MGAYTRRQGGNEIYAIVRSGGKQYRGEPDQVIDVDRLPVEIGSTVDLDDVLLIAGNGDVHIGRPTLQGARVVAEVVEHGRDAKIVVFKYKAKTRYHRRRGHRQGYTRLTVRQILTEEAPVGDEEKPKRRRATKKQAEAVVKPTRRARRKPKPAAEASLAEAPDTVAKPARRSRARKAEAEVPSGETSSVKTPEAEAKPARRSRARKPTSESKAESPQKARRRSTRRTETENE